MRIIIVRHGETTANDKGIIQGQLHGKLNEKGILQAEKIGESLKKERIEIILTSGLARAYDTAKLISRYVKAPIIVEDNLKERNFGIFQGKSREEFFIFERSLQNHWKNKPEEGESFEDLYNREREVIDKIFKDYYSKNILIVAHGDVSRMLIGILTKKDVEESCKIKQANACINVFENGKFKVLNSTEHLGDLISKNKTEI